MNFRRTFIFSLAWMAWVLGTVIAAWAQSAPIESTVNFDQLQSFKFAVVQIPVWVTGKKGLPEIGLRKKDFRLFIDERRVPIENCMRADNRPVEMVYLLDISGSMAVGRKLEASVKAITHFIELTQPQDRWRVIVFADRQVLEIADESQPRLWYEQAEGIRAYGKTALFDALSIADHFFKDDSHANRAIMLFTDGNDNQSLLSKPQILKILEILHVPVFVVGIADGFIPSQPALEAELSLPILRAIAQATGGNLFLAKDSSYIPAIQSQLAKILRPQYLLTITVERNQRDRRHDIAVKLNRRKSRDLFYRRSYMGSSPTNFKGVK